MKKKHSSTHCFKIHAVRLGLAGGVLCAALMFIFSIISMYSGYAGEWMMAMDSIYPGYMLSWGGAFLGAIYGFIDGFVGLYLLGWIYNRL